MRKMDLLMQKYIRNPEFTKKYRETYGDDNVQPQCLNIELCYEEQMDDREKKYGLKPVQKFDDTIINNRYQDNLIDLVKKHYKKTNFKDPKESVREVRSLFSTNLKEAMKE